MDVSTPEQPARGNFRATDTPYLGRDERQLLELGKDEHRETTARAQRCLQVAEKTQEVAQGTLVEIHRQGQQLERAELGLEEVGREVKEASALLRFMRRCCCFQCSDCCDPTLQQDRTRKQRVAMSRKNMALEQQHVEMQYGAKQEGVERRARQHDPAYGGSASSARRELMAQASSIRDARLGPASPDIGYGLADEDRAELRQETVQQDVLLGRIGEAVESLHAMSKEMHGELAEQQPRIDRLGGATTVAHDQVGSLARQARKI